MNHGLTNAFSRFLRRRRRLRHFGRHPLQDVLAGRGPRTAVPEPLAQDLLRVAGDEPAAAIARLKSHAEGLSPREAAARLARHGPNVVGHEKPLPWAVHLWHCYKDPFNLLLTVLAVVSYATADAKATLVIGVMVVLSTAIRFVQEHRSTRAAEQLKAMVSNTATVLRQVQREIPIRKLVAGDLVILSAGDMIPADCRVLSAHDLFIAQAALTGESLPVKKLADRSGQGEGAGDEPLEQRNLVFMGTNVVSGSATAVVVNTGEQTYFGALASRATATDAAPNAFQAGINSVSWLLIRFAAVMVPIVMLVNGVTKGDWLEAFLFALSVAVGLTPEMLPMIVTSTLAKGAVLLSRKKVVVKRLDAIQNLGAMDVLCTDKTGTLTQDKIALERHIDAFGRPSDAVLNFAYLNSHYQTGLKNLLDRAVLDHVELPTELKLERDYRKVDEIPFDFQRRRMSVVVSVVVPERDDHHELICKGAIEEVLAVCTRVRVEDDRGAQEQPLDAPMLGRLQQVTRELNEAGLRVVAVAMKELPPSQTTYSVADESDLVLVGYVAFLDPPKESAAPALRALAAHGISRQGAERRQRTGHGPCLRPGRLDGGAGAARRAGGGHERRGAVAGGPSVRGVRQADPAAQGAHRACAAGPGPRGRVHGRRYQRRAGAARGRHRHLGGLRRRHRQGGGRHHPAREEPDGAGRRRPRGPRDLLQHAEVHPDDGEFEFRQRVLGAGGECLPALPADAAAAAAGAEPAVRHLADRHSVRQRRCRAGAPAAALEPGRHRPVHGRSSGRSARSSTSPPSPCCGGCSARTRSRSRACSSPAGSSSGC